MAEPIEFLAVDAELAISTFGFDPTDPFGPGCEATDEATATTLEAFPMQLSVRCAEHPLAYADGFLDVGFDATTGIWISGSTDAGWTDWFDYGSWGGFFVDIDFRVPNTSSIGLEATATLATTSTLHRLSPDGATMGLPVEFGVLTPGDYRISVLSEALDAPQRVELELSAQPLSATMTMVCPSSPDGVMRSHAAIPRVQLGWSEPVAIDPADVQIVNEAGEPVGFSLSGSGTAIVTVSLDVPLYADTYTITVAEGISTLASMPLDGPVVTEIKHAHPADVNCDRRIDVLDVIMFFDMYLSACCSG